MLNSDKKRDRFMDIKHGISEHLFFFSSSLFICSIVVVALLFYVHGKHLRSCRDGQLT